MAPVTRRFLYGCIILTSSVATLVTTDTTKSPDENASATMGTTGDIMELMTSPENKEREPLIDEASSLTSQVPYSTSEIIGTSNTSSQINDTGKSTLI